MADTIAEAEISDFVQDYLEAIPGDSPAGSDASNSEEYFKLNMEFPKTVPDYKNWIELSDIILKEKSKDIKVASWMCFALYRTEQLKGFKNGLELVYNLLKKFGNDLFPINPVLRGKAIQFLNNSRVTKLIERENINKSNADDIAKIGELLNLIITECGNLMPGNVPVLQSLQDIIAAHSETSQKVAAPPPPEKVTAPQTQPKAEIKPAPQAAVRDETPAAAVKTSRPASEDEAGVQLRRILSYYYEVIENNETIERIPEAFFTFGIARQLQWSTMPLPSAEEKITNIEPPNDIIRKLIKDWFNESKIDVLIPRIELEFIKDNSEFRYWLDAQKYLVLSLEKKGGNYLIAAFDIKYHLARLIKRLPDLQSLKFSGGEIPFAEKDTIKWLDEIGRSSQTSEKTSESGMVSLAPIVDATYGEINAEYDQAIKNLPKGFEDSFKQMQQKLSSEERPKGKFLRRLNIGNLCYEAKQYSVAKVNLEELKVTIDEMNLAEWEPALSASVWQALYLTNVQLLFTTENDNVRSGIEKEQEELFNKIAKYNGILAINLEQQKHKRRK